MHWGSYMNQLAALARTDPVSSVLDRMFTYALVLVLLEGLAGARTVKFQWTDDKTSFSVWPFSLKANIVYWGLIVLMKIGFIQ